MALLSACQVSKSFQDNGHKIQAVENVSLEILRGEMVAIIGPSGSGKSTLLNIMGAVLVPDFGEVYVDGQSTSNMSDTLRCHLRNKYFGYIVQDFALIEEDTAMQNILIPTLYTHERRPTSTYRNLVLEMAQLLNIDDKLQTKAQKLSGGERQRVAIIRSMICDQQIILADEPTGSLDKENSEIVMACLRRLVDEKNKSVVIVTHDLKIANSCDRILNMIDGTLIESACF